MADASGEEVDLKTVFKTARRRPLNFALLVGKDGLVLETHLKRPPEALRRAAKQKGGGHKGAVGQMAVNGQIVELRCVNENVPRNLPKLARKHFTAQGFKFRFSVVLPGGEVIGDAEEGEEGAPAGDGAAGDGRDAAMRQKLTKAFRAMNGPIRRAAAAADAATARRITALAKEFAVEVKGGDVKRAGAILTLLKRTLDGAAADAAGPEAGAPSEAAPGPSPAADTGGGGSAAAETPAAEPDEAAPAGDDAVPATFESAIDALRSRFSDFWDAITAPSEGDEAIAREREAIEAQQARIRALYEAGPLDAARLAELAGELARLGNMVETANQIAQLGPDAATEARQVMGSFDEALGPGVAVTPELEAAIAAEIQAAEEAERIAGQHLAAAEAMADGPAKEAALEAARNEMMEATVALDTARGRERAARGKRLLTEAITTGPLGPDALRPITDQSAAEFIAAFEREPELADFAVDRASRSMNPDAIASGMNMLVENMATGFADMEGRRPSPPFDAARYARNLVRGASAEGGDYMLDAELYIRAGGPDARDPVPNDGTGQSVNLRERARSNYIADAIIGTDGTIDVESEAARTALGHLRFNPDVIDEPTPSLNAHVAGRYELLADADNRDRAQMVLDDIDEPQGAGRALVSRSTGSPDGTPVTDDDARQAVMSAFMTPVHQGPVGSCFSTAGVRRMSILDPLESMERYAELAETGVFTPRNGLDPIPAVLSFTADENPLIRSMEYSAATAMVAMEENSRNRHLQNALNEAIDGLTGPVGDHGEFFSRIGTDNWEMDSQLIRATLVRSFMVEYDSMPPAASSDGSSDRGVYQLVRIDPKRLVIDSRDLFVKVLTERVLTAIKEPADSEKAEEIRNTIASEDYLNALMDGERAPWNLGGGGIATEADMVLFGGDREFEVLDSGRTGWDNLIGTTSGERTEELLENLVEGFREHDGEGMVPIRSAGIHAFNGLPDHPSLAPLLEGDVEDNIDRLLVEPGGEISRTSLPSAQVYEVFEAITGRMRRAEGDADRRRMLDGIIAGGPGIESGTPGEVVRRIEQALDPYLDRMTLERADAWRAQRLADGHECDEAARDRKRREIREEWDSRISSISVANIANGMSLPTFTFADSNWGDGTKDVNFVVAPNPVTGEAMLYQQDIPSGRLYPMGEDWIDTQWMEVVEDD